jgi:molecular chaperone Hsp33
MSDQSHSFLFNDTPIRGKRVHTSKSYLEILKKQQYHPKIELLLGEFMCAAALLSSTLKFDGNLTLQIKSEGRLKLLVAECENQQYLRAIARTNGEVTEACELLNNMQLAITIKPRKGKQYQGIVNTEDRSLTKSLERYFSQSEQLPTRIWLASDGKTASGLLLQKLPQEKSGTTNEENQLENWNRLCILADTCTPKELLSLNTKTLLHRLYHDEDYQVFDPSPLTFRCQCSRERSSNALLMLGQADALKLATERPKVTIDCQFCHQTYTFNRTDIRSLFTGTRH